MLTADEQVAARDWDLVALAVSTPALSGAWLPELLSAVGGATVLTLQPGPPGLLGALATPDERVVKGLITLISAPAPTAWLQCDVMALEGAGWSFEHLAIEADTTGTAPHWTRHLARPLVLRTLLRAAPRVRPLPLEAYLHAHFAKVSEQAHGLAQWAINEGFARQLPTEAMTELARRAASRAPSDVG